MKCSNCNQDIIIHDNLIPRTKGTVPVTTEDKTTKGMIFTEDGLRNYSNKQKCEVC